MLLSLNWLRDYLLKADIKIDAEDLAHQLTMIGLPVAATRKPHMGWDNIVVGRIEKIERHPNADRLQVTHVVVEEGPNAQTRQIVCGAKNIAEGDIVPVALPGAMLPGDLAIKVSKIRGTDSYGMICSGKELGLSDDSDGILQLPKHSPIGEPLTRLLGHEDTVLEFELTPNRPDCMSVIGLAREIVPILRTKLREPKPTKFRVTPHRTSSIVTIEVESPDICPRYVARVIDGLKVAESPDWIKQRLQSVGIRPINNIVDITNFVMLEYGEPLHAFDLRKISSGTVKVKACKEATEFELLNGQRIQLQPNDILIQDGDRPIALAGIMGGANTQIMEDTTTILLESAVFNSAQIRRTARRLGLHTDSSKRFERGVDLNTVAIASERAAALLRECFNANVYHPPIDTNDAPAQEKTLAIDMRDVRKITGLQQLSLDKTADVLESIGLSCHKKSLNILSIRVPSFRLDLNDTIDIIEEVARLVGYDVIPLRYPHSTSTYQAQNAPVYDFEWRARNVLSQLGLRETIHFSFSSEEKLRKYRVYRPELISLSNPLSDEMKVLRSSCLPGLLETYLYNKNRKVTNQRLFEISNTFLADEKEETKIKETLMGAGLLSGNTIPTSWNVNSQPVDFYFAKGLVDHLVRKLTTVKLVYESCSTAELFHPAKCALLRLGLREVGYVGEVHPYIASHVLETQEPVLLFELNLEALKKFERTTLRFKEPSKFPSIDLDIALVAEKSVTCQMMIDTIRHAGSSILQDVEIFDVYEGDNIPLGRRSVGFRLYFASPERTLNEEEAIALKDKIVQSLAEKHSARLRT